MRTFAIILLSALALPAAAQKHAAYPYYYTKVYSDIGAHYVKPPSADAHDCVLRFSVAPDGVLLAVQALSCANVQVQRAAFTALAAALPLPAPPEGLSTIEINLRGMSNCAEGGPGCAVQASR